MIKVKNAPSSISNSVINKGGELMNIENEEKYPWEIDCEINDSKIFDKFPWEIDNEIIINKFISNYGEWDITDTHPCPLVREYGELFVIEGCHGIPWDAIDMTAINPPLGKQCADCMESLQHIMIFR